MARKSAQMATSYEAHKLRRCGRLFQHHEVPGNLINFLKGRECHGGGGIERLMMRAASKVQRKSNERKSERAKKNNVNVEENLVEAATLKFIAISKRLFANSIEKKYVGSQVANPLNNEFDFYKKQVDILRYVCGAYERKVGQLLDCNSALFWESDTSISDAYSSGEEDEKG